MCRTRRGKSWGGANSWRPKIRKGKRDGVGAHTTESQSSRAATNRYFVDRPIADDVSSTVLGGVGF